MHGIPWLVRDWRRPSPTNEHFMYVEQKEGGDVPSFKGRESTTTTENEASGSFSLISSQASMRACSTTEDLAKVTTE